MRDRRRSIAIGLWILIIRSLFVQGLECDTVFTDNSLDFSGITISDDGQRIYVISSNTRTLVSSADGGQSWANAANALPAALTDDFESVSASSDGSTLMLLPRLGSIYVSNDSASSWDNTFQTIGVRDLTAISGDGTLRLVATDDKLYISNNATIQLHNPTQQWFSSDENSNVPESSNDWGAVAVVRDSSLLLAGSNNGNIYVSGDRGETWSEITVDSQSKVWKGIDGAHNGNTLYACEQTSSNIWKSTNQGTSWNEVTDAPAVTWTGIETSSDGSVLLGSTETLVLYSEDSGTTWSNVSVPNIEGIAMASDGETFYVCTSDGHVLSCPSSATTTTTESATSTTTEPTTSTTTEATTTTQAATSTTTEPTTSTTTEPVTTTQATTSTTTEEITSSTTEEVTSSTTEEIISSTTEEVTSSTTEEITSSTTEEASSSTTEEITSTTPAPTTIQSTTEQVTSSTQATTLPATTNNIESTTESTTTSELVTTTTSTTATMPTTTTGTTTVAGSNSSSSNGESSSDTSTTAIVASVVSILVFLLAIAAIYFLKQRSKKSESNEDVEESFGQELPPIHHLKDDGSTLPTEATPEHVLSDRSGSDDAASYGVAHHLTVGMIGKYPKEPMSNVPHQLTVNMIGEASPLPHTTVAHQLTVGMMDKSTPALPRVVSMDASDIDNALPFNGGPLYLRDSSIFETPRKKIPEVPEKVDQGTSPLNALDSSSMSRSTDPTTYVDYASAFRNLYDSLRAGEDTLPKSECISLLQASCLLNTEQRKILEFTGCRGLKTVSYESFSKILYLIEYAQTGGDLRDRDTVALAMKGRTIEALPKISGVDFDVESATKNDSSNNNNSIDSNSTHMSRGFRSDII